MSARPWATKLQEVRTTRLNALLAALTTETWPGVSFVMACVAGVPWAVRMVRDRAVAVVPLGMEDYQYVASMVPDTSHEPPAYYAETKLGAQASDAAPPSRSGQDVEYWATHAELVAYLRQCI